MAKPKRCCSRSLVFVPFRGTKIFRQNHQNFCPIKRDKNALTHSAALRDPPEVELMDEVRRFCNLITPPINPQSAISAVGAVLALHQVVFGPRPANLQLSIWPFSMRKWTYTTCSDDYESPKRACFNGVSGGGCSWGGFILFGSGWFCKKKAQV